MLVKCPSGLTVELRKLKVQEANILADKQAQQKGATLDQLLGSVWVATADSGPYGSIQAAMAMSKLNWEEVLSGDRFYAQLQVRVATHGPNYDFRVPCAVCREVINWTVNLDELPTKPLKEDDARIFQAGNSFDELGPDGRRYKFHLMTGRHEKKAQQILKSNRTTRVTASLLSRIDEIEGVVDRAKYLNDLDFTTAIDLVQMLDEHDCGVETDFEIVCEECNAQTEVTLPLDQAGYWAPSRKAMKTGS